MSSRPGVSPLTPSDQTEIARALRPGGAPGATHQTYVTVRGRRIAVNAVWRPAMEEAAQAAFSAVATRRAEARADRLLPVLATGCHEDCYWIAYEFGAATPLASEGWRRWPSRAALDLLSDLADAVDDAASHGVLAYELGPGSIFVDPRVGPLLGDFGTAREAFGSPALEDDGGSVFVAPEVANLNRAGARSGVYAAGALLYSLLSGGPPRPEPVTHWRKDLADDINLVIARAMARDPIERYRTAAELCDSARRALADQLPSLDDQEEPPPQLRQFRPVQRPPAAPTPRPELTPLAEPPFVEPELADPAVASLPFAQLSPADFGPPNDFTWHPPESRFARPLRAAVVIAMVGFAAFAGVQFGKPDAPASNSGAQLMGDGVSMTLPRGWSAGIPRGNSALSAYPNRDWFSGLTARLTDGVPAGDRSDPVRLGPLDMWRDRTRPGVVRYTAPTTEGALVVSCEAASGATPTTLPLCERAISTMQLERGRALPLSGVVDEPGIRAAVTRLDRSRKAGRARLARAGQPAEQKRAAIALASAYEQAARRLARVPPGAAAAADARGVASAYRELATAADGGKTRAWTESVQAVRRVEAALSRQLAAGG